MLLTIKTFVTLLTLFITFVCQAEISKKWETCSKELQTQVFPRQCFVMGVLMNQKGFDQIHKKNSQYCLKVVNHWPNLEPADQRILQMYYPKCYYVWSSRPSKVKNKDLNPQDLKDLVRFLYLQPSDVTRN